MTDKEKADCLLKLHEGKLDHFIQTRTIEFQVNIAIWTLIIAAGSFFYGKIHLEGCFLYNYFNLAQIIFFIHLIWMILIQRSESIDHDRMNNYRKEIAKLTGIKELEFRHQLTLWGWGWVILEVSMTLFLLFSVGLILSVKQC